MQASAAPPANFCDDAGRRRRACVTGVGRSARVGRQAIATWGRLKDMDTNTKAALAVGTAFVLFLLAFVLVRTFLMI